jgi:DNA-binding NarL/FixJ family response regulator
VRVVVVEDHALLRAGVVELLSTAGVEVVGEAADAAGVSELVRLTRPDVVILDIRMPPTHTTEGLELARSLRAEHGEDLGVVLLSQHVETAQAVDLLTGGAAGVGYLLKDRVLDPADLVDAIERVAAGGSVIDPVVIEQLLGRSRADDPLAALTERERAVLAAMAEGRSNTSIASTLFMSAKTVEAHTGRIFAKLGLAEAADDHRRVLAVLAYLRSR